MVGINCSGPEVRGQTGLWTENQTRPLSGTLGSHEATPTQPVRLAEASLKGVYSG